MGLEGIFLNVDNSSTEPGHPNKLVFDVTSIHYIFLLPYDKPIIYP